MKIERSTPVLVDRGLLVRVYTDAGIVGTGEAGLWSAHPLVCEAISERPDLSLAGGFTQVKKIAALAEAAIGISPVNIAALVEFDAVIPNYFPQEPHTGADALNDILDTPLQREDDYVVVPERPGIGVEVHEEMLARFPHRRHTIVGAFRSAGPIRLAAEAGAPGELKLVESTSSACLCFRGASS